MRIDARIDRKYGELSAQEKRVADFILDHLGDLATYSAAELSRLSGVSKPTVTRLFRRLGFADFQEVKAHTRGLRAAGIPMLVAAPPTSGDSLGDHLRQEVENLQLSLVQQGAGQLDLAIERLTSGRNVLIVGLRNSYPVALHLRQQLAQVRSRVWAGPQPGQTLGEELAGMGAGDTIVLVGFRRRPEAFARLVGSSVGTGAEVILIADPTARRLAGEVTCWLECRLDTAGAFDSYASAFSLVSLLANGVLGSSGQPGRKRISSISEQYESLRELEV